MKHFRTFQISYIPCTNFKGSRVKIKDLRHNMTKIINYDPSKSNIYEMAQEYLEARNIPLSGFSDCTNYYSIFTDNFDIYIK